jgi:BirA family biotin operon repressor/biotin-[acetyl-CoA-carboxylase] ligase
MMNEQIVAIFESHPGEFISGQRLSQMLQCSRTAVWKHIQTLRSQGYDFEAAPRAGYRLRHKPDVLDVNLVTSRLQTAFMGHSLHYLEQTDSTQTVARELAENGAREGTVVIAEQQSSGRGRMGRKWHSPPGKGIWMSIVLKPRIPIQLAPQLTLLAAVALSRSIKRIAGVNVGIKWPNDLLIGGKKVCGILMESNAEDERLQYVIAGIGISVNLTEQDYPESLREIATSLRMASGQQISREQLLVDFFQEFEHLYNVFHDEGFSPIRTMWEANSISLHHPIRVTTAKGVVEGTAEAIDEFGALIVALPEGTVVKIYSGDVQLLAT